MSNMDVPSRGKPGLTSDEGLRVVKWQTLIKCLPGTRNYSKGLTGTNS